MAIGSNGNPSQPPVPGGWNVGSGGNWQRHPAAEVSGGAGSGGAGGTAGQQPGK